MVEILNVRIFLGASRELRIRSGLILEYLKYEFDCLEPFEGSKIETRRMNGRQDGMRNSL